MVVLDSHEISSQIYVNLESVLIDISHWESTCLPILHDNIFNNFSLSRDWFRGISRFGPVLHGTKHTLQSQIAFK